MSVGSSVVRSLAKRPAGRLVGIFLVAVAIDDALLDDHRAAIVRLWPRRLRLEEHAGVVAAGIEAIHDDAPPQDHVVEGNDVQGSESPSEHAVFVGEVGCRVFPVVCLGNWRSVKLNALVDRVPLVADDLVCDDWTRIRRRSPCTDDEPLGLAASRHTIDWEFGARLAGILVHKHFGNIERLASLEQEPVWRVDETRSALRRVAAPDASCGTERGIGGDGADRIHRVRPDLGVAGKVVASSLGGGGSDVVAIRREVDQLAVGRGNQLRPAFLRGATTTAASASGSAGDAEGGGEFGAVRVPFDIAAAGIACTDVVAAGSVGTEGRTVGDTAVAGLRIAAGRRIGSAAA